MCRTDGFVDGVLGIPPASPPGTPATLTGMSGNTSFAEGCTNSTQP
jgi:hypothetical protein